MTVLVSGRRYAILVGLTVCAISYTAIWDDADDGPLSTLLRRQLAYLDVEPSPVVPYGRALVDQNFQSLSRPSDIDGDLFRRKTKAKAQKNAADGTELGGPGTHVPPLDADPGACDDVLVFMPYSFGHNGHGSQLNNYLLAAMIATFTDRAMVVLEPPNALNVFKSNSQFGCPPEAWKTTMVRSKGTPKKVGWNVDFPSGLSRLIKHPVWLSRGCPVPCPDSHGYADWDAVRGGTVGDPAQDPGPGRAAKNATNTPLPVEVVCRNGGRDSRVLVLGGSEARDVFWFHYKDRMLARAPAAEPLSLPAAAWARRLGARPHEARTFGALADHRQIWDYVSALTGRTGILRFQPWIARDAEAHVRRIAGLPLDAPYDGIHVRRGDKLASDARRFVVKYWEGAGRDDPGTGDAPRDYIPFAHYLRQFDDDVACLEGPRLVYVATDDPAEVRREIADLPKDAQGRTFLTSQSCHRFRFVFGIPPRDVGLPPDEEGKLGFHLDHGTSKGSCEARYARSIAGIADLMILAKSDIFVGEFNSNWGRLIRTFRMKVNDSTKVMNGARPVVAREMKIAWAHRHPGPPGW